MAVIFVSSFTSIFPSLFLIPYPFITVEYYKGTFIMFGPYAYKDTVVCLA